MANFTPNYNLRKPVGTEQFDIDRDFNANWDVIDGELKERETAITALEDGKADKADTYTKTEVDDKDTRKADKSTTYTKTEVDSKDATKADKLMATNLITNGDFSQGTTGWTFVGQASISGGKGYINQTTTPADAYFTKPSVLTVGRKYYLSFLLDVVQGGLKITGFTETPTYDTDGIKSGVFTASAGYVSFSRNNGLVINEFYVDNILLIDLTTTFSAGNEPTKEQMDRLLAEFPNSWFDGTQEILPLKTVNELLSEKANKAQEAWITPTLSNGFAIPATRHLRYRKNDDGVVYIDGFITGGSQGATAITMPSGYGPFGSITFTAEVFDFTNDVCRAQLTSAGILNFHANYSSAKTYRILISYVGV